MIEGYGEFKPSVGDRVYVAPSAIVIGDVVLGAGSSIWPGAVVRGDVWKITVGELTNIQDGCVCHVTTGGPDLVIGRNVTVGHRAVLHSCTIEDGCLIGMGAIVVLLEAVALSEAGHVQPMPRPTLPILRQSQQMIDKFAHTTGIDAD